MMSMPEFVIEEVLRKGLKELQNSENIDILLENIYGKLLSDLLKVKYGQAEIDKLKTVILDSQFHIAHHLPESSDMQMPSISLHLQNDNDDTTKAAFSDWDGIEYVEIPIDPTIIVDTFNANSYVNGKVYVPDVVDLSNVSVNNFLKVSGDQDYTIISPISNEVGNKYFYIKDAPNIILLSNLKIISAIDVKKFKQKIIHTQGSIMIGIHSQNSLLTKLLYHLFKYIIYNNLDTLYALCYNEVILRGSDFNQALSILPEQIYSRFLIIEYKTEEKFINQEIGPIDGEFPAQEGFIDSMEQIIRVENDICPRDTNQTVQTTE